MFTVILYIFPCSVTPRQHVEIYTVIFTDLTFHTAIIREFVLIVAEFDVYSGVTFQSVSLLGVTAFTYIKQYQLIHKR